MSGLSGNSAQCTVNAAGEYSAITSILDSCGRGNTAISSNQKAILNTLAESYRSQFQQISAEVTSLTAEFNGLNDNKPALGATLTTDINELRQKKTALESEITGLNAAAAANSADFEENTAPLNTSSSIGGLYTLQDWVTFLVFITYIAAAVSVLAYVGYSSQWNKKSLLMSTISLTVITMILYSFFISFA